MPKPAKPYPDFPLFSHSSGKWAKKIGGRMLYFGRWDDPAGALAEYQRWADTMSGQSAPAPLGLTVQTACNHFLNAKREAVDRGELSARSWQEYFRTCKRFMDHAGALALVESIQPQVFAAYGSLMAQRWNLIAVGNEVTRVRSLFRWCHESRLIREPVHFGPNFQKPGTKALRRHRRLQGKKLFTAEQIRRLLDYAGVQMRAMILLGINGGFGPTDCATLPSSAIEPGWVRYPRPKTEVDRDIPLWPETAAALKDAAERRYTPQLAAEGLLFVQPDGQHWGTSTNPIAKHFRQLYLWSGLKRGGFYWLRHTFETIGGGAKDQIAVNAIMGHADASMAAVYREEIDPARLAAVTDHVRGWLFS